MDKQKMGNNQTSSNSLSSFSGAGCVSYVRFLERERALANQGYSGTPLYKKMHDDMFADIGCFVAGTLVTTDKGKVPIQDIKVGDLVLSKPENGIGEPSYKPVLKTFVHEDKPIWMVRATKSSEILDKNGELIDLDAQDIATETIDFLATPNHPVWVVGMSLPKDRPDVVFYDQPHWKRVDELQQHEVAVNADGVMYRMVMVQPLYRFANDAVADNPDYYWYEEHYGKDYEIDYLYGDVKPDFDVTEGDYRNVGRVQDIVAYQQTGLTSDLIKNESGDVFIQNELKMIDGEFIPYTTAVYNLEVADNHTYFIDYGKLWVHNTNCEQKALEALLGKNTLDGFKPYKPTTTKTDFPKHRVHHNNREKL